ncbi:MAG: pyridoxamine 5'-phosphate oxidase family protein [Dehalococcoidia bacterium]|nr:MAG: pyridoxamine 5'-phosphate oxidase family protein [Dehalococcoidia bacterium]
MALRTRFNLNSWRCLVSKLSDKVKETIAEIRPGIIATASKDGKPNVSAKGSFRVLDDDHVVFADISSPRTIANLKENPQVSVLVIHPKSMKGCRIWGKGEIIDSGELFNQMSKEFAELNLKVNHVVKITVEETQDSF